MYNLRNDLYILYSSVSKSMNMIIMYGILDNNLIHHDVSMTLLGAKQYATRNGYINVSKRSGYIVRQVAMKVVKEWINVEFKLIDTMDYKVLDPPTPPLKTCTHCGQPCNDTYCCEACKKYDIE